MWVWSLGWKDPLEKEMATHSSILTWKIPWTEAPGGLPSRGSHRVGHNWMTNIFTFMHLSWTCDLFWSMECGGSDSTSVPSLVLTYFHLLCWIPTSVMRIIQASLLRDLRCHWQQSINTQELGHLAKPQLTTDKWRNQTETRITICTSF